MEIVGYVASEEGFFETPCRINCSVEKYCAFTEADRVLEVDRVYEKKLANVGEGIMVSEPVVVEKGLRVEGISFSASLSHQGILAIFSWGKGGIIQFSNLINGKQVEVGVENESNVAFYDNRVILLTYNKPLREAGVDEVFKEHDISVFKKIGDVDGVYPDTDTSLLHSRRTLYYISMQDIPYEYNVDTRVNKRIEIGQKVYMFSSLIGTDCGVKGIFQKDDNMFTYTLGWDNKVTPLHEVREGDLTSLFVSSTHPKDLSKSVLKYRDYLIKGGNKIDLNESINFEECQSVVRIYRDIFLLLDKKTKKWVLSRIIIP